MKDHPVTFLMGIGGKLHSGKPHDGRAPDYDDWDLNGDLLVWDSVNGQALELSSMGIRVSPESLDRQLTLAGCDSRRDLPFHKMLLDGELPSDHGRRHRPVPGVHAPAGQGPHRRGAVLPVGPGHRPGLQAGRRDPAVTRASSPP